MNKVPYINFLGQKIKPGQKVLAITEGYSHSINIDIVTYVGLSRYDEVQVEREVDRYNYVTRLFEKKTIITTLKLNRIYKLKGIK